VLDAVDEHAHELDVLRFGRLSRPGTYYLITDTDGSG
jgi:hypothetical protein